MYRFTAAATFDCTIPICRRWCGEHPLQEMQYEKRSFEVNPLLCVRGAEMRIVSIITDIRVVDRIVRDQPSANSEARKRALGLRADARFRLFRTVAVHEICGATKARAAAHRNVVIVLSTRLHPLPGTRSGSKLT